MVQSYDNKERRRKALKRKQEEKRRNPMALDLASKKYRQRIREVKEKDDSLQISEEDVENGE